MGTGDTWTEEDKLLLVEIAKRNESLTVIEKEFNEKSKTPRGRHALANTLVRLRQKGLLPHTLRRGSGNPKPCYYSKPEAERVIRTLFEFWYAKGYTTHDFYAERVHSDRWSIRSNLVGGLPPKSVDAAPKQKDFDYANIYSQTILHQENHDKRSNGK